MTRRSTSRADKASLAKTLNLPLDSVRVQCPYTGGGFGCKGSTWSHVPLAAMAAKIVQKPVKLVLDRTQMFGPVGARPTTVNRIKLSAGSDGKLLAIEHDAIMHTSTMEDFVEPVVGPSRLLYASEANRTTHKMVDMNVGVADVHCGRRVSRAARRCWRLRWMSWRRS